VLEEKLLAASPGVASNAPPAGFVKQCGSKQPVGELPIILIDSLVIMDTMGPNHGLSG
jgi:hypothetical protein